MKTLLNKIRLLFEILSRLILTALTCAYLFSKYFLRIAEGILISIFSTEKEDHDNTEEKMLTLTEIWNLLRVDEPKHLSILLAEKAKETIRHAKKRLVIALYISVAVFFSAVGVFVTLAIAVLIGYDPDGWFWTFVGGLALFFGLLWTFGAWMRKSLKETRYRFFFILFTRRSKKRAKRGAKRIVKGTKCISKKLFNKGNHLRIVFSGGFVFDGKKTAVHYIDSSLFFVLKRMHFFLHGGVAKIASEKNKKFFQNICRDGDKILICVFASEDRSKREERFLRYKEGFVRYNPDKRLSFELASTDIPTFVQQIKQSSVIYFGGGYENNIFAIIKKIPHLRELLQNKTLAGSSAGANIRSKVFYTQDLEEVKEGLGFLEIKTICHRGPGAYAADKETEKERVRKLDAYGEKLPIYKIPEQEYIEFTL